jgi:peptidoglycan hydrolase-like protein with peptidoglycan-binding domain
VSRIIGAVAALAAVGVVAGGGWWFIQNSAAGGPAASADPEGSSAGLATAAVERRTLTVSETLSATLGYVGEYSVLGGLVGTLTWFAPEGTVVTSGQALYEVDGSRRASLMYGRRPAWRTLETGVTDGTDVRQLEENLLLLGYTRKGDTIDRHWDSDTTAAVKRWQRASGLKVDGSVELGEVVFLPEAIRITEASAELGSGVGPGGPLLSATSNRKVVSLDLDSTDRDLLDVGTEVSVELPDGTTVDGAVASIGRVAQTQNDQQGGSTTTLPVTITLTDATAGADLDQAPVDVTVVRSSRENVLTVPVNALLALLEGGYAVEVVDGESAAPSAAPDASPAASGSGPTRADDATTHLVRVEPGLFDNGFVEITAEGLEPGDVVVVPS